MTPKLTIFFDSTCPLCAIEMKKLAKANNEHKLAFVSLQDEASLKNFPELNQKKAMNILQGQLENGRYIEGLDVTHKAWSLVGKGYLTAVLRFPIIAFFADKAYLMFAKNRYRISALLTGKAYRQTSTDYGNDCACQAYFNSIEEQDKKLKK